MSQENILFQRGGRAALDHFVVMSENAHKGASLFRVKVKQDNTVVTMETVLHKYKKPKKQTYCLDIFEKSHLWL